MGVFTQLASNIKGFARKFVCKCDCASCVNGALDAFLLSENWSVVGLPQFCSEPGGVPVRYAHVQKELAAHVPTLLCPGRTRNQQVNLNEQRLSLSQYQENRKQRPESN